MSLLTLFVAFWLLGSSGAVWYWWAAAVFLFFVDAGAYQNILNNQMILGKKLNIIAEYIAKKLGDKDAEEIHSD